MPDNYSSPEGSSGQQPQQVITEVEKQPANPELLKIFKTLDNGTTQEAAPIASSNPQTQEASASPAPTLEGVQPTPTYPMEGLGSLPSIQESVSVTQSPTPEAAQPQQQTGETQQPQQFNSINWETVRNKITSQQETPTPVPASVPPTETVSASGVAAVPEAAPAAVPPAMQTPEMSTPPPPVQESATNGLITDYSAIQEGGSMDATREAQAIINKTNASDTLPTASTPDPVVGGVLGNVPPAYTEYPTTQANEYPQHGPEHPDLPNAQQSDAPEPLQQEVPVPVVPTQEVQQQQQPVQEAATPVNITEFTDEGRPIMTPDQNSANGVAQAAAELAQNIAQNIAPTEISLDELHKEKSQLPAKETIQQSDVSVPVEQITKTVEGDTEKTPETKSPSESTAEKSKVIDLRDYMHKRKAELLSENKSLQSKIDENNKQIVKLDAADEEIQKNPDSVFEKLVDDLSKMAA